MLFNVHCTCHVYIYILTVSSNNFNVSDLAMFLCDYINCNFKIHNVNVIKTHVVLEHGIAFRNRFKFVNSGNSKKRGQTVCSHCQRSHNNRARSNQCTCGHDLLKVKNVPQLSVYKLYGNIFSVRKNIHGICKRVIVDLENKVC